MNAKLAAAAASILWGFTYVVTTSWLPPNPMFLAAFRAVGGAVVLLAVVRCLPERAWWGKLVVLGTLNAGVFFALFFVAATRLPGGVAATFQALTPLAVVFIAWAMMGARPTWLKMASVLLGAGGVSLVVLTGSVTLDVVGIAAALGSMLSIALGGVLLNKWGAPRMPLLGFTGWQLLVAGVELSVIALIMQDMPAGFSNSNILGLVLLAVALTAVPFALWFGAIERGGAVAVAPMMLLAPITAFVLDALVKGEQPTNMQMLGAALVMAGLILNQRATPQPHKHAHHAGKHRAAAHTH